MGVLVLAVLAVVGVGGLGLQRMSERTHFAYRHTFAYSQHAADLVAATEIMKDTALHETVIIDPRVRASYGAQLNNVLVPRVQVAIADCAATTPANRLTWRS